ncbi:MAG: magnesium chelatase [Bacillota bacterium]|nr:magnesium chelatase [Bacillota bacterium]
MAMREPVRHAGNEPLYQAVELSVLARRWGVPLHLHAQGLRGTGKTTVLRAARPLLPPIRRIRGCLFNCDPRRPHCPEHRGLEPERLEAIGSEEVPTPFLEISASAKIGTVVGTIDLGRLAADRPALLPGTIAQAHRGILFIDEINRLADVAPELADVLLDVMGTRPGRLQIEEAGLPRVELPVNVTVWAASNPDEEPGPLEEVRRQLADRFDLLVHMGRPSDPGAVEAILRRDPLAEAAAGGASPAEAAAGAGGEAFAPLRAALGRESVPAPDGWLRSLLAAVYTRFGLESLRTVEAWQLAARLEALRRGRPRVEGDELLATLPLVLSGRMSPEEQVEVARFLREPALLEEPLRRAAPAGRAEEPRAEASRPGAGGPAAAPAGTPGEAAAGEEGWLRRMLGRLGGGQPAEAGLSSAAASPAASGGPGGGGEAASRQGLPPAWAPPGRARPWHLVPPDERFREARPEP